MRRSMSSNGSPTSCAVTASSDHSDWWPSVTRRSSAPSTSRPASTAFWRRSMGARTLSGPTAQPPRVGDAQRDPLDVEVLEQRLGVAARGPERVADLGQGDLVAILEQRDDGG